MKSAGRVLFLTVGGAQIGLGHVKRCLALAQALASEGADIAFVLSPDPDVARIVERSGFPVIQRAWESGPSAACAVVSELGADVVIVDAYVARTEHFQALRHLAAQLVAIDDTAERRLPVDVVVNVGAGTEAVPYRVPAGTTLLLGSRYALVDPAYAKPPARIYGTRVERVLVTLGGSVHPEALRAVVAAVDAVFEGACLHVVVGPFGNAAAIDGAARPGRNRVTTHGHVPGLGPLMLDADLAVTGAGVTLYELAATATPAVMVMTEPNQARNVAAFESAGAALFAGPASAPDLGARLRTAVTRLAGDRSVRAALGAAGRLLVDGQGAIRVARELASMPGARR
ncbi:MAG: UDP-2,4-diacetamido-2,4,6-trideoxy-beta-L-altropyranose hydrolase [Gemmatimonadales bacterium]